MKRFLCVLLVALALVGLMTTVASAEEYATVVSDNGYGVRMREGPGKVYRVITKYDVGTTVIVQQRGTEWSQIRVGETVGWMMNESLRFGTTGTGTGTGANADGADKNGGGNKSKGSTGKLADTGDGSGIAAGLAAAAVATTVAGAAMLASDRENNEGASE